jgi:hypothetical protein
MARTLCLEDRRSTVRILITMCLHDRKDGNFKQNESQYLDEKKHQNLQIFHALIM